VKIKNKLGIKVLGLVVFSLLLAVNCAEKGTDPEANIPPNTFITNFQIDVTPAMGTDYNTRVYWKGNDEDGAVFWYYWKVIGDADDSVYVESADSTINLSTWQVTPSLSAELTLDFPTFDKKYIFQVMAQDNDRSDDPTPAIDTLAVSRIRDFNYLPNTEIVTGPPNGALTGQGIYFVVKGTDIDGAVDTIAYKIDDGDWTYEATDINTGILDFAMRDIPLGARTITFVAFDNFRACDPTPVSVSVVVMDSFEPEVAISVVEGFSFIVPFTNPQLDELVVTITPTVDFYYSAIDSLWIVTSEGDDIVTAETEITFNDLADGDYWIEVTAYDIGGNSHSTGHVNYRVVALQPGDGILCINGVDWGSYATDNTAQWNAGTPWGNRTHYKIWDVFSTTPLSSLNANFTDSLLGSGSVPAWMIDTLYFDAINWFANVFSGDDAFWTERETEIMAYLEMGGNIYLPSRRAHFLFFDDLTAYTHVASWVEDGTLAGGLTAVYAGLSDISGIGSQSFSSVPTLASSSEVTTLYTNSNFPGASPGFIVMPNGIDGGGKFCFIGGRNYRWNHTELKATTEFIMDHFFGIEN